MAPPTRRAVTGPDGKPVKKRPPRTTPKKWLVSDSRSQGSGDSTSAATPTSVNIGAASVLTRDLSDLSGSYLNGTTVRQTGVEVPSVYQSDQSATSYQRPWRLAKILSSREPSHPQPPQDCNDSVGLFKEKLLVGPHGLVEVVSHCDNSVDTGDSSVNRDRQPIVILLMDPGRKMYELMQLWIDLESDSVRDVLHAIQLGLSNRWRQDYDGLFQTRNNTFSQLIHILDVSKYDVQPMELWVAKPWAMPAKTTVNYASRCVQHLQQLQMISQLCPNEPDKTKLSPIRRGEETILVLSKEAQTRSYVPGGIMKHYHAFQFLSFSPPFESSFRVDVLAGETTDDVASQLSDSQVGTSFASASHDDADDPFAAVHVTPHDTSGLNAGTEVVRMRLAKYPTGTKQSSPQQKKPPQRTVSQESSLPVRNPLQAEPPLKESNLVRTESTDKSTSELRGIGRLLSILNCRKSSRSSGSSRRDTDPLSTASPLSAMETMKETSSNLWRVWEDEVSTRSQISASRPLLRQHVVQARTDRSDWL